MLEFELGQKKKSRRAGRAWKKQLIFSFFKKKNNGIDSFGGKTLKNSRTMALTV